MLANWCIYLHMCFDVFWCVLMCFDVFWCVLMCFDVFWCVLGSESLGLLTVGNHSCFFLGKIKWNVGISWVPGRQRCPSDGRPDLWRCAAGAAWAARARTLQVSSGAEGFQIWEVLGVSYIYICHTLHPMRDPNGAGRWMLTWMGYKNTVYWWDPWHTIYSINIHGSVMGTLSYVFMIFHGCRLLPYQVVPVEAVMPPILQPNCIQNDHRLAFQWV